MGRGVLHRHITLNKTLIAANRPWIAVAIDPAGPIIWRDGGLEVSYKITLKNIGKSPALKVSYAEAIILDRDANLAAQQQDLGVFLSGPHPLSGLANIMPQGRTDAPRAATAENAWSG
jgi:hypothetical protein